MADAPYFLPEGGGPGNTFNGAGTSQDMDVFPAMVASPFRSTDHPSTNTAIATAQMGQSVMDAHTVISTRGDNANIGYSANTDGTYTSRATKTGL